VVVGNIRPLKVILVVAGGCCGFFGRVPASLWVFFCLQQRLKLVKPASFQFTTAFCGDSNDICMYPVKSENFPAVVMDFSDGF